MSASDATNHNSVPTSSELRRSLLNLEADEPLSSNYYPRYSRKGTVTVTPQWVEGSFGYLEPGGLADDALLAIDGNTWTAQEMLGSLCSQEE